MMVVLAAVALAVFGTGIYLFGYARGRADTQVEAAHMGYATISSDGDFLWK